MYLGFQFPVFTGLTEAMHNDQMVRKHEITMIETGTAMICRLFFVPVTVR